MRREFENMYKDQPHNQTVYKDMACDIFDKQHKMSPNRDLWAISLIAPPQSLDWLSV